MGPRSPLASQALPLPPGKASGPLLRQRVVVGVFLRSVKQHFSVGHKEKLSPSWQPTGNTGAFSIQAQEPRR